MSSRIIWTAVVVIAILILGALYQTVPRENEVKKVDMINNQGDVMGSIKLSETKAGVLLSLDLEGLDPDGEHAIHIHETGKCTPLETFKDAGGHFNPKDKSHGMKHPTGQHAGDMPNLIPDSKGRINTSILNRFITLKNKDTKMGRATIYDEDGSSIMIHAGADDHMSQPSGAAGDRIMCGVIQ